MTQTIPDLWPKDFGQPAQLTPLAILRQQGIALGQKTANLVYGEVQSRQVRGGVAFAHIFQVVAPSLGFRRPIAIVYHHDDPYPATIGRPNLKVPLSYLGEMDAPTNHLGDPTMESPERVNSAEEFMAALKAILQSEETTKLIQILIAQTNEPLPVR